ncbi:MAG: hypothetical protein PWQ97_878 [Tepidanaerobacteraceae bacterium]|nr:hypothetical protein [Tepidanaerobacteraceae bacterium]
METGSKQMVFSGLFIAIGVVLPIMFHAFGAGSTFLPMHIPVLLSGFFVDVPYAFAIGAITPILSSLFTGMPPAFPVLPYMIFELATYGATASFAYKRLHLNPYLCLLCSMISGRVVAGFVVWVLATFFAAKLPGPLIFIAGAVAKGIPGIIIQLVIIPPIVFLAGRYKPAKKEGDEIGM